MQRCFYWSNDYGNVAEQNIIWLCVNTKNRQLSNFLGGGLGFCHPSLCVFLGNTGWFISPNLKSDSNKISRTSGERRPPPKIYQTFLLDISGGVYVRQLTFGLRAGISLVLFTYVFLDAPYLNRALLQLRQFSCETTTPVGFLCEVWANRMCQLPFKDSWSPVKGIVLPKI